LHDDDRLCSSYIEKQLEYLLRHPEVGAITCNGYWMDTEGNRTGRTLREDFGSIEVERYSNAAQVAIRYAGDSCLPLSPMFYRAAFVRQVPVRLEFGKVTDAILFCDLADVGQIAYQSEALYECRTHAVQESSYFPELDLARLTDYFLTRQGDDKDVVHLRQLLVTQHTSRQLRRMMLAIFRPLDPKRHQLDISQIQHPLFSSAAALQVSWGVLVKRSIKWLGGRSALQPVQTSARVQSGTEKIKQRFLKLHFFLSEQLGINPLRAVASLQGAVAYLRDLRKFRREFTGNLALNPCLGDRYQEGGATKNEYFWQDLLVARRIFHAAPTKHVDVGSRIDGFVAHVASFREVEVFDIRQVTANIPGVVFRQADMMSAAYLRENVRGQDGYCDSLSCLHAIEHFGLGRYGDPVDPLGYRRGIANLASLLRPLGRLYLSTPIGRERVEFNANWVFHPQTIVNLAAEGGMRLDELIVLDADGDTEIFLNPSLEALRLLGEEHYRLGIFFFTKLGAS
jgi:hypothetical protein